MTEHQDDTAPAPPSDEPQRPAAFAPPAASEPEPVAASETEAEAYASVSPQENILRQADALISAARATGKEEIAQRFNGVREALEADIDDAKSANPDVRLASSHRIHSTMAALTHSLRGHVGTVSTEHAELAEEFIRNVGGWMYNS